MLKELPVFTIISGQHGIDLHGKTPRNIDQRSPVLPPLPPAFVGRIGPENKKKTNYVAKQGMHQNRAVKITSVIELKIHHSSGIGPDQDQYPKQGAKGIAFVEFEDQLKPVFGIVTYHGDGNLGLGIISTEAKSTENVFSEDTVLGKEQKDKFLEFSYKFPSSLLYLQNNQVI